MGLIKTYEDINLTDFDLSLSDSRLSLYLTDMSLGNKVALLNIDGLIYLDIVNFTMERKILPVYLGEVFIFREAGSQILEEFPLLDFVRDKQVYYRIKIDGGITLDIVALSVSI